MDIHSALMALSIAVELVLMVYVLKMAGLTKDKLMDMIRKAFMESEK